MNKTPCPSVHPCPLLPGHVRPLSIPLEWRGGQVGGTISESGYQTLTALGAESR
jgi:hypothetical protein